MKRRVVLKEDNALPIGTHHEGDFGTYMTHKVAKLRAIQNAKSDALLSTIFEDCIMFVNGATNPPVEEIRRLVSLHGGECVAYRIKQLTHLVCDHFTDAQLKEEFSRQRTSGSNIRMIYHVTASWVMESIQRGKRQPEALYTPKELRGIHGNNIARYLTNAQPHDTSLSTSSCSANIDLDFSRLDESQRAFIISLPFELQREALEQCTKHINIPTHSSSSSSSISSSRILNRKNDVIVLEDDEEEENQLEEHEDFSFLHNNEHYNNNDSNNHRSNTPKPLASVTNSGYDTIVQNTSLISSQAMISLVDTIITDCLAANQRTRLFILQQHLHTILSIFEEQCLEDIVESDSMTCSMTCSTTAKGKDSKEQQCVLLLQQITKHFVEQDWLDEIAWMLRCIQRHYTYREGDTKKIEDDQQDPGRNHECEQENHQNRLERLLNGIQQILIAQYGCELQTS